MSELRRALPESSRRRGSRARLALGVVLAVVTSTALAIALGPARPAAAAPETYLLPASGSVVFTGNGIGHGHGMSQYGARGAAAAGLTPQQIVAYYYPNTTLRTMAGTTVIRVRISAAAGYTCVLAKSGLSATGVAGTLSASGVAAYRMVPSGAGLALQRSPGTACTAGTWTQVAAGLPSTAGFSSTDGFVRLILADGSSTDYWGSVNAVRSGTGEVTVNNVGLDKYAQGVSPRETPSSWPAAAGQAQAIAARTYGEFEREESAGSGSWDICDYDACQVYGGKAHYPAGATSPSYTDSPASIVNNAGQILSYGGAAAFAQFGASSGGWTVAGGQPYLTAHQDKYDNSGTGDPYIHWTTSVAVSSIAASAGLARATQLVVTQRDGNGEWGGRVLQAQVVGYNSAGTPVTVSTTGQELADDLGLYQNWFTLPSQPARPAQAGGTVVNAGPGATSVLYQTSGQLFERRWSAGAGWQDSVALGAPTAGLSWDPDAYGDGTGHIDLAARDGQGELVTRSYSAASGWTGWQYFPDTALTSSPAVVTVGTGQTAVFYRGAGNTLSVKVWTSGYGWGAASTVAGATGLQSGPDATALGGGRVAVTYRGVDGRLWLVTGRPAAWAAPTAVNPGRPLPVAAAPVDPSVDGASGAPSIYYTGVDGAIYHSAPGANGVWGPWFAVPASGGTTSAPDVAGRGAGHIDLLSGRGGVLGTSSWSAGTGWRGWSANI